MTSTMAPARALRQRLLAELEEARARTLLLVAPLSDEELHTQHDPLMSPILWDLGHIAHFEELWLTRNLDGPIEFVEMPGMYNPFEHSRSTRGALPLPSFPPALRDSVIRMSARVLGADGEFRQITNMPWVYLKLYRTYFRDVSFRLVPLNLPPGGVYFCRGYQPAA